MLYDNNPHLIDNDHNQIDNNPKLYVLLKAVFQLYLYNLYNFYIFITLFSHHYNKNYKTRETCPSHQNLQLVQRYRRAWYTRCFYWGPFSRTLPNGDEVRKPAYLLLQKGSPLAVYQFLAIPAGEGADVRHKGCRKEHVPAERLLLGFKGLNRLTPADLLRLKDKMTQM